MKQYTITLTEAEDKALSIIAYDQNEWIQHAVHERCRVAIEDIVSQEIKRRLDNGEPIVGNKEDIILSSNIETAAERHVRLQEEYKKLQEQQG